MLMVHAVRGKFLSALDYEGRVCPPGDIEA